MPPKQKVKNNFEAQLEAIAKKPRTDRAVVEHVEEKEVKIDITVFEGEGKEDYFNRIVGYATKHDIAAEYYNFLKKVPKLLNNQSSDLLHLVRKELRMDDIECSMNRGEMKNTKFNFKGVGTPIFDALGYKLGYNLINILAPPTLLCLLCKKPLVSNNNPTQVILHKLSGPELSTKYMWRCKSCVGAWKLSDDRTGQSGDVHYHPDRYGNPDGGYRLYQAEYGVSVIRGSNETYYSSILVKSHWAEKQHCWMSAEGKSEAYNETFRNTEGITNIQQFLLFNTKVGGHFKKLQKNVEEDDLCDYEVEKDENIGEQTSENTSRIWEMKRKNLSQAIINFGIDEELNERDLKISQTFGPKLSPENKSKRLTYRETVEDFMKKVDEWRKEEVYAHENCSEMCAKRGCKWVVSVDGLWKLSYPICMWEMMHNYPGEIDEYLPNACPEDPAYGKAFCHKHSTTVEELGYPSDLRPFLDKCGANSSAFTKEGQMKVTAVLKQLSKMRPSSVGYKTTADSQGTGHYLRNKELCNKENFTPEGGQNEECRKDIGERLRLRRRSRGIEAVVSGGGIIYHWAPLYKSEGPTQVALLMLRFLQIHLKNVSYDDWGNFFLSYDNICHIDELKLLQKPLALPDQFSDIWLKINKVIDPLHIKNHTRLKCKELYDPEKVRVQFPEANLMCAEQTFAWMGRYKKILNSTPKTHFHFLLHRLVIGRNKYTEHCYKENKKPLLPSAKVAKSDE